MMAIWCNGSTIDFDSVCFGSNPNIASNKKNMVTSISIIHPSRNRPEMASEVAKKWISMASKEYPFEYILSIDSSDSKKDKYMSAFAKLVEEQFQGKWSYDKKSISIIIRDNKSAIQAINNAASQSKYDLLIVISDDFDCFENWDKYLIENLREKEDFIVKTDDGLQPTLITLPIMDRKYYNRFGYVYYPEYLHMFCDTEMTDVGHILGKVIALKDKQFTHKHYIAGYMQKDEINEKNDATWNQGETLYNERKKHNFYI